MKKLTKEEHMDLFYKVDQEGFEYYMMYYGPDLNAIEKLGFNKEEIRKAIKLFKAINAKIYEAEEFIGEV